MANGVADEEGLAEAENPFWGQVTGVIALKILLTYTVPFSVATWSALDSRVRKV